MWDQLANLPPPALMVFAAVLAVIFAVRHMGLLSGANTSPDKSPAAAQVAAVIVDPTALNRATAALESHTAMISKVVKAGEDIAESIDHMKIEIDRVREELRIHREINRRGGV